MVGALLILLLLALVLMPRPSGVDILIALKEMNQRIAPAALACQDWSYPEGSVVLCQVESSTKYADVEVTVLSDGIEFTDPDAAQVAIAEVLS